MHACIQFPFNHFFPFLSIRRSGGGRDEYRHSQHRHGIRSKHGMLHVTVSHYVSKCNALCTLTWGAPADVAHTHTMIRCEAKEVHWHAAVSALHFAADIWIQNTRALAHSHAHPHPHALLMSHAVFYVPPRNEHVRGCTFPLCELGLIANLVQGERCPLKEKDGACRVRWQNHAFLCQQKGVLGDARL